MRHNFSKTFGQSNQRVDLKSGEKAIFGYGSLISVTSLERSLKRRYDGPFMACALEGWQRSWDVVMPNEKFYANIDSGRLYPKNILYLNIQSHPYMLLAGVLFVVTANELEELDQREWIYDRKVITKQLRGVHLTGGNAYTYIAKPEWIMTNITTPGLAAIRMSYLELLEAGFQELGDSFRTAYNRSSHAMPQHLVIKDFYDQR
ncbi:MAG: gamma-glutamylcyclotransferase family protein [Nitrospirales bacterium]